MQPQYCRHAVRDPSVCRIITALLTSPAYGYASPTYSPTSPAYIPASYLRAEPSPLVGSSNSYEYLTTLQDTSQDAYPPADLRTTTFVSAATEQTIQTTSPAYSPAFREYHYKSNGLQVEPSTLARSLSSSDDYEDLTSLQEGLQGAYLPADLMTALDVSGYATTELNVQTGQGTQER